jgi:hypothetical protein
MAITNILPDPTHAINAAGQASPSGVNGPGYMGVQVSSLAPVMKFSSNARRQDKDLAAHHRWKINISYNPLTCEQLHLLYGFIGYRTACLQPFYVSVPPFSSQVLAGTTVWESKAIGSSIMTIVGTGVQPGYLFNVAGSDKAYKVTRVETNANSVGTPPAVGHERLHFTPGLHELAATLTEVVFTDPLFYVSLASPDLRYSITKEGLFNLSLSLVEELPDVY